MTATAIVFNQPQNETGNLGGAFPLPAARVADLRADQVGRFVQVSANLLTVGGCVYFGIVRPAPYAPERCQRHFSVVPGIKYI